ncbi:allatostatin-A receptor-like [Diadema antillarum]|uniref:allatostatin-A receptor-like n=1 Tax=Diadema antillarum TaxID=105358 RepID=UPI003A89E161
MAADKPLIVLTLALTILTNDASAEERMHNDQDIATHSSLLIESNIDIISARTRSSLNLVDLTQSSANIQQDSICDVDLWNGATVVISTSDAIISTGGGSMKIEKSHDVFAWSWYPLEWTWWNILQLTSALLGLFGNAMVILVLYKRNSSSRSTDILLGSLALVDLVTSLLVIPVPALRSAPDTWAGYWYCVLVDLHIPMWITITASTYTLVAISIDRYFAIVHPLTFNRLVSRPRVIKSVALMWLAVFLVSGTSFFVHKVDSTTGSCGFVFVSDRARLAFAFFTIILRLVFPVTLLVLTQILIVRTLHRQAKIFARGLHSLQSVHLAARDRVIFMLFLVIVGFVICWTPGQVMFLGLNVGFVSFHLFKRPLHLSFIVLSFFNSCLNPIIYTVAHPQFRREMMDLISGAKRRRGPLFEHDCHENSKVSMTIV